MRKLAYFLTMEINRKKQNQKQKFAPRDIGYQTYL